MAKQTWAQARSLFFKLVTAEVSSWLMLLAVLVTAALTSWIMLRSNSARGWAAAAYYPPQQVAQNLSPGIAAMEQGGLMVAGTRGTAAAGGIPVIRAGSVPPHADRGVCTTCHLVVSSRGYPIPPLRTSAALGHEYRGVCSNCHRMSRPGGLYATAFNGMAASGGGAMMPVAAAGRRPWRHT